MLDLLKFIGLSVKINKNLKIIEIKNKKTINTLAPINWLRLCVQVSWF